MKSQGLLREFPHRGMKIPDPNPNASVEVAARSLAGPCPELANAKADHRDAISV